MSYSFENVVPLDNAGNYRATVNGQERTVIPAGRGTGLQKEFLAWMAENGDTVPKFVPPVSVSRRVGNRYEVRKLFTTSEFQWFYEAAKADANVAAWLHEVEWVVEFDLDHPTFEPVLGSAVHSGGLTAKRKAEIMATDFNASQG